MSDAIDLAPDDYELIIRILEKHAPECEARAFGSRVKGTSGEYSDLDLALVGDGPIDWRTLLFLRDEFEESLLPFNVDVLDWRAISPEFREVIARRYVVLRSPSPAPAPAANAGQ